MLLGNNLTNLNELQGSSPMSFANVGDVRDGGSEIRHKY